MRTNSAIQAYLTCPMLHHFRYIEGYDSVGDERALDIGRRFHMLLEDYWDPSTVMLNDITFHRALADLEPYGEIECLLRGMWISYSAKYSAGDAANFSKLSSELEFSFELGSITVGGKIDAVVCKTGSEEVMLIEHKTTGGLTEAYWSHLPIDRQVSIYMMGVSAVLCRDVRTCLYDVVLVPRIKRKSTESHPDFIDRVAEHAVCERREIYRMDSELARCTADIRAVDALMQMPPTRNPSACGKYGRPCAFLECCTTGAHPSELPSLFSKKDATHSELSGDIE